MADIDHCKWFSLNDLKAARQRVSRSPDRTAASISPGNFSGACAAQPQQKQGDGDGGIVELKRAEQVHFEEAKIVFLELEIEALRGRRDGFVADPDLVADKQGSMISR